VTHAAEVADRARRCITLQDGQVIKDDGVSARSLAPPCDLGIAAK
jgi:ABC-type lipoprotein export system ATPase subunit